MEAVIPIYNVAELVEKVEKANEKAARFQMDAWKLVFGKEVLITPRGWNLARDPLPEEMVAAVRVELEGSPVCIEGWNLEAVYTSEGSAGFTSVSWGTEVQNLPEEVDFTRCDHCGTRRGRSKVFIFAKGSEVLQVGSACLKDFVPARTVDRVLFQVSSFSNLRSFLDDAEYFQVAPGSADLFPMRKVLRTAASIIREFGFFKSNQKGSTKWAVIDALTDRNIPEALPEDEAKAEQALEWIAKQSASSDYIHNLQVITNRHFVESRHVGYLVSLIPAADRAKAVEIEEARNAASEYVGTPGDKVVDFGLTFVKSFGFETAYGYSEIYIFHDSEGNVLTWKTSSFPTAEGISLEIGDTYKARFTIKDHTEYRGTKQTVIVRTKLRKV